MSDKPSKQQRNGRIGGLVSAAMRTPAQEANRKTRAAEGRIRRYLDQVPAEITDPSERMRRAELLQRAHMQRIAAISAARRSGNPRPKPAG